MLKSFLVLIIFAGLLIPIGCDTNERVATLEKENKELKDMIGAKDYASADLDAQAKCSRDAKTWFNENFERDKDTILLTFINHHNRKQNKCFIFTEFHYNSKLAGPGGSSWSNVVTVWDIYENSKFGDFAENHYTYYKPEISTRDEVITCEVSGRQCKTMDEFNNLVRPDLND